MRKYSRGSITPIVGLCTLLIFLLVGCQTNVKQEPIDTLFHHKSVDSTGVSFINLLRSTPELNILNYIYYYNGGGVAVADFNNDGLDDLYFTGNQVPDALYLNLGNLKFKEITEVAGIRRDSLWTTGVTSADVNGDGLLDIYVCKPGGQGSFTGTNLLYINQGSGSSGIPQFKEVAKDFGLDFQSLSTQAAFFDYDLDGDLDMYLLNHSTNPNQNYGRGSTREIPDSISGDKLFEMTMDTSKMFHQKVGSIKAKPAMGWD